MKKLPPLRNLVKAALLAGSCAIGLPNAAIAYPIDCAILLCMSGGFPASGPCTRAKAEVIRRITPNPHTEPPLQIWNCPMRAAELEPNSEAPSTFLTFLENFNQDKSTLAFDVSDDPLAYVIKAQAEEFLNGDGRADIDLTHPDHKVTREVLESIKVYDVRMRVFEAGKEGQEECRSENSSTLGSYNVQGEYKRNRFSPSSVAWLGVNLGCGNGQTGPRYGSARLTALEFIDFQGKIHREIFKY